MLTALPMLTCSTYHCRVHSSSPPMRRPWPHEPRRRSPTSSCRTPTAQSLARTTWMSTCSIVLPKVPPPLHHPHLGHTCPCLLVSARAFPHQLLFPCLPVPGATTDKWSLRVGQGLDVLGPPLPSNYPNNRHMGSVVPLMLKSSQLAPSQQPSQQPSMQPSQQQPSEQQPPEQQPSEQQPSEQQPSLQHSPPSSSPPSSASLHLQQWRRCTVRTVTTPSTTPPAVTTNHSLPH